MRLLGLGSLACLLVGQLSAAVEAQVAVPSFAELRTRLAERDAFFKSLAFRVTYHVSKRGRRGSPLYNYVEIGKITLDTSPGVGPVFVPTRAEIMVPPEPDVVPRLPEGTEWLSSTIVATPGRDEGGRRLATGFDGRKNPRLIGQIHPPDQPGIVWAANPSELLSLNYWSPSHHLTSPVKTWRLDGMEEVAGHQALRLRWSTEKAETTDSGWVGTYWICPDLGYAVVRSVTQLKAGAKGPLREASRIELDEFMEVQGAWLPRRAHLVEHALDDDGTDELRQEVIGTFEDWAVNQALPAETFELDFPDGALVYDYRTSTSYTAGRINDRQVARQVGQARRLAASTGSAKQSLPSPDERSIETFRAAVKTDPFARQAIWRWVAAGVVVALVAIALAVVMVRGARKRSPESDS